MRVRSLIFLICTVLLVLFSAQPALANPPDVNLPPGFYLVSSEYGVSLFKKDYPNGTPDYVQVLDLEEGASLEVMHGELQGSGEGKGVFGGVSPKMSYEPLESYWSSLAGANENAFCVTNGGFFYMPENPTKLSLPLKKDGTLVTEGYAALEFPGQTLMLEIWPEHADIKEMNQASLYGSDAPDIIGGLKVGAPKRVNAHTGRTFVGVDDRDGNGFFETVMVFNTRSAKQSDAEETLTNFGADKVMMLDGGGSTQLICKGEDYVASDRWIPQAIGILGAVVPPYQVSRANTFTWPVMVDGEEAAVEIELENSGRETWQPGDVSLQYQISPNDSPETIIEESSLPLESATEYGQSIKFRLPLKAGEPGSFTVQAKLLRGEEPVPGDEMMANFVILPAELSDKRVELDTLLRQWSAEENSNIPVLVENWVNRQEVARAPIIDLQISIPSFKEITAMSSAQIKQLGIEIENLLIVPMMILPMAGVFFLIINNRLRKAHSRY